MLCKNPCTLVQTRGFTKSAPGMSPAQLISVKLRLRCPAPFLIPVLLSAAQKSPLCPASTSNLSLSGGPRACLLFPFPTPHSLDAVWGSGQYLAGRQRVPLDHCWVQPQAPLNSGATQHSLSSSQSV